MVTTLVSPSRGSNACITRRKSNIPHTRPLEREKCYENQGNHTKRMVPWYEDMEEMQQDDHRLQRIVATVVSHLCAWVREEVRNVHVYPSRSCTWPVGGVTRTDRTTAYTRWTSAVSSSACVMNMVEIHTHSTMGRSPDDSSRIASCNTSCEGSLPPLPQEGGLRNRCTNWPTW